MTKRDLFLPSGCPCLVVETLASGGVLRIWTSTEDRFRAVLLVSAARLIISHVLSFENHMSTLKYGFLDWCDYRGDVVNSLSRTVPHQKERERVKPPHP